MSSVLGSISDSNFRNGPAGHCCTVFRDLGPTGYASEVIRSDLLTTYNQWKMHKYIKYMYILYTYVIICTCTWYCIIKSFQDAISCKVHCPTIRCSSNWPQSSGEMLQKRVDSRKPLRMQALGILVTFTPFMSSQFRRRRGIPSARPKDLKRNTPSMERIGGLNKFQFLSSRCVMWCQVATGRTRRTLHSIWHVLISSF